MRIQRSIVKLSCPKTVKNFRFTSLTSMFCLLALSASLASVRAGTLYLATASGGPGELYIIDAATGATLKDVGPLNDSSSVNYAVTGLAFHPTTGVLYGSSASTNAPTPPRLLSINPATAQVTVIGLYNANAASATMADIAFDSTGNLYGVASRSCPNLFSIDTTTGQATQIGNTFLTSTSGGGLAIDSTGVIYGAPTASRFGTYNLSDGTFVNNGTLTKPAGGGSYAALAFDEHGVLYGLNSGPGTPPPTHLVIINTNDLTVTDIGASVSAGDAIAFQPPVAAAPALTIATQGASQAALRWPDSPGFQLEYKANLNNAIWLTNTPAPIVDNGTNVVTVTVQDASFFRLHKP